MTNSELKLQIDTDITNKISQKSITPLNVGKNIKDTVDYIDQQDSLKENISNKSVNIITDNNSDIKYPTTKAVATYVDNLTAESWTNKSTNVVTDATSDIKYPTVKAIKNYVDANVGGNQDFQSVLNNGATAIIENDINITAGTFNFSLTGNSDWNMGNSVYLYSSNYKNSIYVNNDNLEIQGKNSAGTQIGSIYLGGGADDYKGFYLVGTGKSGFLAIKDNNSRVRLDLNASDFINKDCSFKFGVKPTGTYTLATLDDITNINTSFVEETYALTMSVAYNSDQPNFEIHLTGDLNLTLTGTSNEDSGMVNLYFSGTETAILNGFKGLKIVGSGEMIPIYFIHDTDGIKWYDGREESTIVHHIAVATNTGTFSNVGNVCTGVGTTITDDMVGAKIIKANGEEGIIATRSSNTSFTTEVAFSTDSIGTAFQVKCMAIRIKSDGTIENFSKSGSRISYIDSSGNTYTNGLIAPINGNVNLGGQVVTHGSKITMYGSSGEIIAPLYESEIFYTVSTLPSGLGTGKMGIAFVTDALTPTYRGVAVGGGAVRCMVTWDGTTWRT